MTILTADNATLRPATTFATIVELLRYRATTRPDHAVYNYVVGEVQDVQPRTHADLDAHARAIAAHLQQQGATGERVLLLFHPGLEFISAFFGCLYAGAIAIPAPAPDMRMTRTLTRLNSISEDAEAKFVLTTRSIDRQGAEIRAESATLNALTWLTVEDVEAEQAAAYQPFIPDAQAVAYLQYTSGSTSTPKGVMITHHNLMHHSAYINQAWGYTPGSISATWLPYFHDYGLVDGLVQPLFAGTQTYFMSPATFIKHPIRWLEVISHFKVTHSQGPNFAYDYCNRKVTAAQRATLDLSHWRMAGNGAEPIRTDTLETFAELFAPCGFRPTTLYPAYGLAEATLVVATKPHNTLFKVATVQAAALEENRVQISEPDDAITRSVVSCGAPVVGMDIVIVDPATFQRVPSDGVGEIWVRDESNAAGYWQRTEDTERTFRATIAPNNEGFFLRTGDLGFLHEGELYVTGRMKDLIILRGQNHYPQDIEITVENTHPALRANHGAAFSVEVGSEEKLVVVQEIERKAARDTDPDTIFSAIRQAITEHHEIAVYAIVLIRAGTIVKTSSGKIERYANRRAFLNGTLDVVAQWQTRAVEVPVVAAIAAPTADTSLIHTSLYPASRPAVSDAPASESRTRTDALIAWIRDYAETRLHSRLIDERRSMPPYVAMDFGNQGLLGLQIPGEYGGLNLGNHDTMRVFEQMGAVDIMLATFLIVNDVLGTLPIRKYGTPELKAELLPIIAHGRELAAFGYTEPGAGSNPRGIATTAKPDGKGGWVLNGSKEWIGSAAWAGIITVFVQQYNDQHPVGITGFVVRQGAAGMTHGPEALTLGMRGMVQNSIFFDETPVNQTMMLGEAGSGMESVALDAMMYTRLVMSAVCVGAMKRTLQLMMRYASRRSISTGRLLDNPVTLARMSDSTAQIAAAEALIYGTADLLDAGVYVAEEAFVACKTSAPEFLWTVVNDAIQLFGGRGYIETNILPQMLRDARIFRIFEGPTETLNMYLGSRVMHRPEEINSLFAHWCTPGIAARLHGAAAHIQERNQGNHGTFKDRAVALRWAHVLIGEVATAALLWAASEYRFRTQPSDVTARAAQWAEQFFTDTVTRATSTTRAEQVVVDGAALTDLVGNYIGSIGDVEQNLAGEDGDLNPILRRTVPAPTATPVVPATPPVVAPVPTSTNGNVYHGNGNGHPNGHTNGNGHSNGTTTSNGSKNGKNGNGFYPKAVIPAPATPKVAPTPAAPTPAASPAKPGTSTDNIQTWIIGWLQNRLAAGSVTIQPSHAFADYGLDSVTAVELALDLGEWLQIPLEATVVWNFPTIERLAVYLGEMVTKAQRTQTQPAYRPATPTVPAAPTTTNAADSIAQELADLESLLDDTQ